MMEVITKKLEYHDRSSYEEVNFYFEEIPGQEYA